MNADALFTAANLFTLPAWLPLVFAPRWRYTQAIARALVPLILGAVYVYLIATNLGEMRAIGSLREVSELFQKPALMLAGWIHYLVFDLFVGSWEVEDSIHSGVPHWAVIPSLVATNLFGPAGLLLYLLVRWVVTRAR